MPDYELEKMKIRVQIGQLSQNKLATEYRIMQLHSDVLRAREQLDATDVAIADQEAQMASLPSGAPDSTDSSTPTA